MSVFDQPTYNYTNAPWTEAGGTVVDLPPPKWGKLFSQRPRVLLDDGPHPGSYVYLFPLTNRRCYVAKFAVLEEGMQVLVGYYHERPLSHSHGPPSFEGKIISLFDQNGDVYDPKLTGEHIATYLERVEILPDYVLYGVPSHLTLSAIANLNPELKDIQRTFEALTARKGAARFVTKVVQFRRRWGLKGPTRVLHDLVREKITRLHGGTTLDTQVQQEGI